MSEASSMLDVPTYYTAMVAGVFIAVSIAVERSLHLLGKWFRKHGKRPLDHVLVRMKEELMLLGFASILISVFSPQLASICISIPYGNPFVPCPAILPPPLSPSEAPTSAALPSSAPGTAEHSPPVSTAHRRLLEALLPPPMGPYNGEPSRFGAWGEGRRGTGLQGAGGSVSVVHRRRMSSGGLAFTCPEGKEQMMSAETLHQVHIFIFCLAMVHILSSCTLMLLAFWRLKMWKKWENNAFEYFTSPSPPSGCAEALNEAFIRRHLRPMVTLISPPTLRKGLHSLNGLIQSVTHIFIRPRNAPFGHARSTDDGGLTSSETDASSLELGAPKGPLISLNGEVPLSSPLGRVAPSDAAASEGVPLTAAAEAAPGPSRSSDTAGEAGKRKGKATGPAGSSLAAAERTVEGGCGSVGSGGKHSMAKLGVPSRESESMVADVEMELPGTMLLTLYCFFHHVTSPVQSDYHTLRVAFIANHKLKYIFDFYTFLARALEHDFIHVVGTSWYHWLIAVVLLVFNVPDWDVYFYVSFIPLFMTIAIGTKLEYVMAQLAMENYRTKTCLGLAIKTRDDLFWFNKPVLLLGFIHYILFQTSYILSYSFFTLWQMGTIFPCHDGVHWFVIARLIINFVSHFLVGFVTLPLYSLVVHMGSDARASAILPERVVGRLKSLARRHRKKPTEKAKEFMDDVAKKMTEHAKEAFPSSSSLKSLMSRSSSTEGLGIRADADDTPKTSQLEAPKALADREVAIEDREDEEEYESGDSDYDDYVEKVNAAKQ